MHWGAFRDFLVVLAGLWLLAAAPAGAAAPFPPGSTCVAQTSSSTDFSQIAGDPSAWNCSGEGLAIDRPRTILRFDLTQVSEPLPEAFVTRLTRFDALELALVGVSGTIAARSLDENAMDRSTSDWLMSTPLPQLDERATALFVTVDGARHLGLVTDAQLETPPWQDGGTLQLELLLAGLCGMMCLPLVFNLAFYRVLRQNFVLWHAAAVVFMLVHTFVTSGLVNHFVWLSMHDLGAISAVSWSLGVMAAAFFMADLIEEGRLDPVQRRLLRGLALWIPAWAVVYLYADGPLRALSAPLYYASYLPVMGLFSWTFVTAWRRGSRAVNFQIAAWTPLILCGSVRMLTGMTDAPMELQFEQHAAMALEIIITSLGVADRFMVIKRQRDLAMKQNRALEEIAERDPLTGLYNRHGIEERFAELHALGFNAMGVIDIDHFKAINDTHGHATGDAVLRIVAEALRPDEDTLAVRMGGEEFLLLLRGKDAYYRAEHRRQAIALRIARAMPGLGRAVTASMGLVEQPASSRVKCEFPLVYAHCDRLLYEAKRTGRNRTMSERLRSFGPQAGEGGTAIAAA